jgi:transposase-like protein
MELSLAQVGCRCGRRFAPLLQLLGIDRGSRVSPGLARRAAELATELPFARAAAQLLTETGHGLSPATVRRIVARAGERCDLTLPRSDVDDVPAMLIDGTRVPAGPRHGRARSARGVEVNIACAVMGRDVTGRRPRASMELLGASVAQPWLSLHDVVRSPKAIGIVVTDGDNGIDGLLDRALPEVPRQHCTFHVQHNIRLRLWQDGVAFKDRGALTDRLLAPILTAPTRGTSLRALEESITLADDHDFSYAAQHLRNVGSQLSTWKAVRHSRRPWRMDGRSRPEHTTSLLERTMREINRRVDPPGNRWLVPGVRSMVHLVLARRFDHPAWRGLWQDAGTVKVWAGLRGSTE